MKPWGPSWLKLQTEFYPTGFLQARVRQSWEGERVREREGERERESSRAGGREWCVYMGRQAPPTADSPSEPEQDTD